MTITLPYALQGPAGSFRYAEAAAAGEDVEVPSVLDVLRVEDIAEGREALREFVWGSAGYPDGDPEVLQMDVANAALDGLTGLDQIDIFTALTVHGLESYMFHLSPTATSTGVLVIQALGHEEAIANTLAFNSRVQPLLDAGHTVLVIVMPMAGGNPDGVYNATTLDQHDDLWLPEADRVALGYSSLRAFLDPPAKALNLLAEDYDVVAMTGFSGGAWLTHVVAALDTRVRLSYPVAGALPWYARDAAGFGDYEQMVDGFYQIAGFEDLYGMGCSGVGRRQRAIFGTRDPIFPSGQLASFQREIRAVAHSRGCDWDAYVDPTVTTHTYSSTAMRTILQEIARV